ncbi:MAG: YicC/YloC family endoribonuclease [Rikenellaceae bacterium]
MIRSMTGFGKSEIELKDKKIAVEIRTLNSKQLDLSLRMPSAYRAVEFDLRAALTRGVQRGKCEVSVSIASTAVQTTAVINEAVFAEYCRQISSALRAAGVDDRLTQGSAMAALRMPDVISTQSDAMSNEEGKAILEVCELAIIHLNSFREQEGAMLIADLLRRVDLIEEYMVAVEPFEKPRVEAIRERIREHIAKERVDVDRNRLEAEMIFYVEKLDVTEEKVRLKNHCKYFREVAAEEQGVGRKLGFIAQEMGREINTLGSKSNDAGMQRLVVQMKDELEKIKEQVLNIL